MCLLMKGTAVTMTFIFFDNLSFKLGLEYEFFEGFNRSWLKTKYFS